MCVVCMYLYAFDTLEIPEWFLVFSDSEFMIYNMTTVELLLNNDVMMTLTMYSINIFCTCTN